MEKTINKEKVFVPPIKCQGIKTKLVPYIKEYLNWNFKGNWLEPFVGSGVVGFNVNPQKAIYCDTNPHIIEFYEGINNGKITPENVRIFLEAKGERLSKEGQKYYNIVRDHFNENRAPLDFLFLNRSCFNGMIRFNGNGSFNVPFGHKPLRFSKSYITKIVNQVKFVSERSKVAKWKFFKKNFIDVLSLVDTDDFVYCDPPYIGRHVDYYNGWDENEEKTLYKLLCKCPSKFILSTWHSNQHRENPFIKSLWSKFHIIKIEHFYHVGAKEVNRKPMLEALIFNYKP